MKIAITGIDNSHAAGFTRLLNIDKKFSGCSVDFVYDSDHQAAVKFAEELKVDYIAESISDMVKKADAAIVANRLGSLHFDAAMPFIENKIPVFIDKPLAMSFNEAEKMLKTARANNTPISSFSVVPYQKTFISFSDKIKNQKISKGSTFGHCDTKGKYGGVFFYGIHQVDMIIEAFGSDITDVIVVDGYAELIYSDGKIIQMSLKSNEGSDFAIEAVCSGEKLQQTIHFDDNYLFPGLEKIISMFKTGTEPRDHGKIFKSIEILEKIACHFK